MSKIKITRHTEWTITADDGREFVVPFEPYQGFGETVLIQALPDGNTFVGYLTHDPDCHNPLDDCDGVGKIYDRRRHSATKAEFYQAVGRNEDGEKTGKPDPLAVLLDVLDHSGETWSVNGEGFQCPWDTSPCAGVWVPDDCCREHIVDTAKSRRVKRTVVALECARQALEEFNKWLAGDCYGVISMIFDAEGCSVNEDACWGYIGQEYGMEELKARLANELKPA